MNSVNQETNIATKSRSLLTRYFGCVLLILGFCAYWSFALATLSTANPIVLPLHKFVKIFDEVFYQGWYFFSPPPKVNIRLYYIFKNPNDKNQIKEIEVFQDLRKNQFSIIQKRDYVLDCILNGAFEQVRKKVRNLIIKDNAPQKKHQNSKQTANRSLRIIRVEIDHSKSVSALVKYARTLAIKNKIPLDSVAKFVGTERGMPLYSKRSDLFLSQKIEERKIFESDDFPL